jgi:hypothetical protein
MKSAIAILVSITILITTACTAGKNVAGLPNQTQELVAKAALAEVLYRNPEWREEANRIAKGILVAEQGLTTIDAIEGQARDEIAKLDATPATKVLANEVITAVAAGLREDFRLRGVDAAPEQVAQVIEFIEWVEQNTRG